MLLVATYQIVAAVYLLNLYIDRKLLYFYRVIRRRPRKKSTTFEATAVPSFVIACEVQLAEPQASPYASSV